MFPETVRRCFSSIKEEVSGKIVHRKTPLVNSGVFLSRRTPRPRLSTIQAAYAMPFRSGAAGFHPHQQNLRAPANGRPLAKLFIVLYHC
jgi:hypothetical protein